MNGVLWYQRRMPPDEVSRRLANGACRIDGFNEGILEKIVQHFFVCRRESLAILQRSTSTKAKDEVTIAIFPECASSKSRSTVSARSAPSLKYATKTPETQYWTCGFSGELIPL